MSEEKENKPKDLFSQSVDVLGEDFWHEIGELIPNRGPRIDVYHTSTTVVVIAEIPGLDSPDQIRLDLEGQTLCITGEIPCLYPVTENRITLKERFFGTFRRHLMLPKPVTKEGIHARYHRGLLLVEMQMDIQAAQTDVPVEFS
ncbi:Hsp20/alpha crystallin family protein [Cohnella pontilimi]|uniref:Hsp20/alpha crystallin family protein n=1 Tax=Cohnella pontilimi TaxID=2564100 RepID=A0A4U0FGK5_9BACL|nr:Hsp20/alpha crystallin family protein [Cohnella pontilimi]TJY44057.1 Hsp20/alpha crystallin family protein [Cohnella pontilimi]